MLSWIRNLHTCKAETFLWHSEFWLLVGPHLPPAQQELPQGHCNLSCQHWSCVAHPWAAPAGVELCIHGTWHLLSLCWQ